MHFVLLGPGNFSISRSYDIISTWMHYSCYCTHSQAHQANPNSRSYAFLYMIAFCHKKDRTTNRTRGHMTYYQHGCTTLVFVHSYSGKRTWNTMGPEGSPMHEHAAACAPTKNGIYEAHNMCSLASDDKYHGNMPIANSVAQQLAQENASQAKTQCENFFTEFKKSWKASSSFGGFRTFTTIGVFLVNSSPNNCSTFSRSASSRMLNFSHLRKYSPNLSFSFSSMPCHHCHELRRPRETASCCHSTQWRPYSLKWLQW